MRLVLDRVIDQVVFSQWEKMHNQEPWWQNSAMHENHFLLYLLPPPSLISQLARANDVLRDQLTPSSLSCQPCCPMIGTDPVVSLATTAQPSD